MSTNDITHRLRGSYIVGGNTTRVASPKSRTRRPPSSIYYTLWHIYSTEYAAKRLHVLFLWCKVFEKKIGSFFFSFLKRADVATPEFPAAERHDLIISLDVLRWGLWSPTF